MEQVGNQQTIAEYAHDSRTTACHAADASHSAVLAAVAQDRGTWRAKLQETLVRAEQSSTMAFDAVDTLFNSVHIHAEHPQLFDTTNLNGAELRDVATALAWASRAFHRAAEARAAEASLPVSGPLSNYCSLPAERHLGDLSSLFAAPDSGSQ
jgi:hypothetical protein